MKEKTRLFILKLFSAAAAFSAAYASLLMFRTLLFGKSGGFAAFAAALLLFAAGTAAGTAGRSGGRLADAILRSRLASAALLYKNNEEKSRMVASVLLYCSVIVPVVAAFAVCSGMGILRASFEAVFTLVIYLLAIKCGLNEAYGIMTTRGALTGLVVFIFSFGASCYYPPVLFLKPVISIFAYLFLLAYLIVKNQEDIDYNIFSGRYVEKSVLPKEMRSFNLKVVILLFTVILFLLNFKIVVILLTQVGDWLLAGLRALFALFNSGKPVQELQPEANQNAGLGFPFLGGDGGRPEHPLAAYIRGVFVTTFILYVILKIAIALYKYVIKKLLPMLSDMLKRFFRPGKKEQFEAGGDYDDEIAIEKPGNERMMRREARAKVRKARRDLKNISDPVERVRCMYSLVLGLLQTHGVAITGSDTVWDVYAKAAAVPKVREPLQVFSGKYENVRYGDRVPGSVELSETEQSFEDITGVLLKRRHNVL